MYIKFYPLEIKHLDSRTVKVTYPGEDREFDKTVIAYMELKGYQMRHKQWRVYSHLGSCRVFVFLRAK